MPKLFAPVQATSGGYDSRKQTVRNVILLGVAGAFLFSLLLEMFGLPSSTNAAYDDFSVFYHTAKILQHDGAQSIYSTHRALRHQQMFIEGAQPSFVAIDDVPFVYPPPALFFIWPLAYQKYAVAGMFWLILQLLFFIIVVARLPHRTLFPALYAEGNKRYIFFWIALSLPAVFIWCINGQSSLFIATLLIGTLGNLDAHPVKAGFYGGLLIIKPHWALLLPVALIAGKYWKSFVIGMFVAAILVAITLLLWGVDIWSQWFTVSRVFSQTVQIHSGQYRASLVSIYSTLLLMGSPSGPAFAVQGAMAIAAAVALWKSFLTSRDLGLKMAIFCAATLVASPYLFAYDLLTLIPVLLLMADRGMAQTLSLRQQNLFLLAGILPLVIKQLNLTMMIPLPVSAVIELLLLWTLYKRAMQNA